MRLDRIERREGRRRRREQEVVDGGEREKSRIV
jgi:hypothetical protein